MEMKFSKNLLFTPHVETVVGIDTNWDCGTEELSMVVHFADPGMDDITMMNTPNSNPYGFETTLSNLGWAALPVEVPDPYEIPNQQRLVALLQQRVLDEMMAASKNGRVSETQFRRRVDLEIMKLQSSLVIDKRERMRAAAEVLGKITTPFEIMVSYVITEKGSYNKFSSINGRRHR